MAVLKRYTGTAWESVGGPAPSGTSALLAAVAYDPAATVTKNPTTTMTALDTTNLSATFTAPASGIVVVTLSAVCVQTAPGNWYFGILDSGGVQRGISLARFDAGPGLRFTVPFRVAGLTSGTSYTYRFAHMSGAATVAGNLYYGNPGGGIPASITVMAAP